MKKVLTFDKLRFAAECRRLEAAVVASGFVPDVVLGIESGGRYVAELIFDGVEHCYVSLRRPGTAAKQGALTKVLRRMPRFVNDALLLADSWGGGCCRGVRPVRPVSMAVCRKGLTANKPY